MDWMPKLPGAKILVPVLSKAVVASLRVRVAHLRVA